MDSDRVVEAIFNNDFGLSDEEDSESNDENDIFHFFTTVYIHIWI